MSARKKAQATWGGRFSAGPAELMLRFGESVSFDHRLWAQDIRGSKAHATMLAQAGILTKRERDAILRGLDGIAKEIAAGKFKSSMSLTEPNAGSDAAAVRTRAVRDGDHFVINGAKVFNSQVDLADRTVLVTRTDPDAPQHKGISLFFVDPKSPGVTIERLLQDPDSAPLDPRLKTLLAFVRKLVAMPNELTQADADAVFDAGWDEHALHDAIAVTARAAFMQRLVQGYGFIPLTREAAIKRAKERIEHGYVNLYSVFREKK